MRYAMAKALIFFLFLQRPIEKANSRGEAPQRRETNKNHRPGPRLGARDRGIRDR
jgi:hypothetical protein